MDEQQHREARTALTEALVAQLLALWESLGSWNRSDVQRFLQDALPLVREFQKTLGNLAAMRVAERATEVLDRPVPPPVLPESDMTDLREHVTPSDVYERPFHEVWFALKEGDNLNEAVEKGANRLRGVAEVDMQQTNSVATAKAQESLPPKDRPRWWERTLEGKENCLLCVVASTRVYRVGELNPIHPGCDCGIREHWSKPPKDLHPDRLRDAYDEAVDLGYDGTSGDVLRDMIGSHGEVGPVLRDPAARKREARARKRAAEARENN